MAEKSLKIGLIIPAYNEAKVIADVIKNTNKTFEKTNYNFEIIVINDCSTDKTEGVSKKAGAKVITHILNRGAGGATSTGLRYAELNNFDYAITLDADGQHDPEDALACLNESIKKKVGLMIGSRLINAEGMSKVKVLGNKGLTFITWVLFGVKTTDSQSGLRVFSREALRVLEWKSTGYDFASEMIWRAKQAKIEIEEFPIKAIYTDYSKGKGQNNWNAINIVKSLFKRRFLEIFE